MKLFSLTVDFAFKSLFASNPDLLMDLLNSFSSFQGSNRIKTLKVLNPEIPKEISSEKFSIMDIRAENEQGEQFLVEMQAFSKSNFPRRILNYWSKVYARGLRKGLDYKNLKKVYSFNFLGIQINLETRFNLRTTCLIKQIRRIRDFNKLRKILIESAKTKTLSDFRKSIVKVIE